MTEPIKTKCEVCGSKVLLHRSTTQFYTPDTEELDKANAWIKTMTITIEDSNKYVAKLLASIEHLSNENEELEEHRYVYNKNRKDLLQAIDKYKSRIEKLREACEKVDKKQWFEPCEETGICGWCDLHCSQPYLGHNSDCPILIIHNALKADSESEGK